MIRRFSAAAALAFLLLAASGFAQTAAEMLQKGIYTQETAGDLDGAIQIYRQVVASASNQPAIAAQAQFRLTQSLLQKVDFSGVAREFEILARNYPDQRNIVDNMAQRLRAIAENGPTQLIGSVQNGRYRHYWTGVELTAPAGWSLKGPKPQPDGFDRVDLVDGASRATSAFVVVRREQSVDSGQAFRAIAGDLTIRGVLIGPSGDTVSSGAATHPPDIAAALQQRLQAKPGQRGEGDGYHAYAFRPGSSQRRIVGGQQALSAVADYKDDKGTAMNEYLVWVQSEKTKAFFSVMAAAPDFADVMARFEPIVSTAVIP